MINEITANITAITGFPQRSNYISSSAYALAVETWLGEQQGLSVELTTLISQLVTFINETNTESDALNAYRIATLGYKNDALDAKDIAIAQAIIAQGAVSTLPSGIINDATISALDTWSSQKISDELIENTPYNYTTQTSAYTALNKDFIYVDTLATGAVTITLPVTPDENYRVAFLDNKGNFDSASLIVGRNGETIMGIAEDMEVSTKNISFELIYNGTDWRLV